MGTENSETKGNNVDVAVIFGVSGLVGRELARKLIQRPKWRVYGISRRAETKPILHPNYTFISCDLLDPLSTMHTLCSIKCVTHVFWVTWATQYPPDSPHCSDHNKAMMRNALNAILPGAEALKHLSLQTGMNHYMSSGGPFGGRDEKGLFIEECSRPESCKDDNFYHALEDLLKEMKLRWSVHRPGLILGSSRRTLYNFMGCLCVYGAICKHLGLPFVFGGTRECWEESYIDGSDARLVADQHIWAATSDAVVTNVGEAFNSLNGPSFRWREIWPAIGAKLGVYVPESEEEMFSEDLWYSKAMVDKDKVWEEVVEKERLVETEMEDLANWGFMDSLFRCPVKLLGSRDKADGFGFTVRYETLDSILYWVDVMRDEKLIPC